jgi:hypothetical protein
MGKLRNFWKANRRDILGVVLGTLLALLVADYKLAWLVS